MTASTPADVITLHIGTEKTGTSTIQAFLVKNQAVFNAAGLLYPQSPLATGEHSHAGLVHFVVGDYNRGRKKSDAEVPKAESEAFGSNFIPKLRHEILESKARHVLLSSAHLSSALRDAGTIATLVKHLRKLASEIRLIIYLRPQYDMHTSLYSTQIKGGRTKPIVGKFGHQTLINYNYDRKLKNWEAALGADHITVRLFGRPHFKNGDLLDDFFDALRFPIPEAAQRPGSTLNRRLDAWAVEFLRICNTIEGLEAAKPGPARRALIKRLEDVSDHASLMMPAADLEKLDRHFRASNAEVARRYFPDRPGPLFPPFEAKAPDPPAALTAAKAVEIGVRALGLSEAAVAEQKSAVAAKRAAANEARAKGKGPSPAKAEAPADTRVDA